MKPGVRTETSTAEARRNLDRDLIAVLLHHQVPLNRVRLVVDGGERLLASPRGGCSPRRRASIERRNELLLDLVDLIDPDGELSVRNLSDAIGLAWRAFKSPRDADGVRTIHSPFPLSHVAHILGDLDALNLANIAISERTLREIIRSKRGNSIRQN